MKLSDKIFIREAAELLGFENKSFDYLMQSLLNEQGLATYFDVNVNATRSTGYERHPTNEDDETLYVNGAPPSLVEGVGKKILEADIDGKNTLSIYRFEYQGNQYCGADSEGTNLKLIVLEFDTIYFDKSEFRSYQDVPAYQDKNHEHYAPELDLAIQLHKAIYVDKHGSLAQNREQCIDSWLRSNYPNQEFSNAKIKRLSAVIGIVKPNKK